MIGEGDTSVPDGNLFPHTDVLDEVLPLRLRDKTELTWANYLNKSMKCVYVTSATNFLTFECRRPLDVIPVDPCIPILEAVGNEAVELGTNLWLHKLIVLLLK